MIMIRTILFLVLMAFAPAMMADRILLDSDETIDTPTAEKMDWEIFKINAGDNVLGIKYRWVDSSGNPIRNRDSNRSWHKWLCRNIADLHEEEVENCTADGIPADCCTGDGTGTCDDSDLCFSEVFGFNIRAQDVGTSIGAGLRTLIWNRMRSDVLSSGNNGSFE